MSWDVDVTLVRAVMPAVMGALFGCSAAPASAPVAPAPPPVIEVAPPSPPAAAPSVAAVPIDLPRAHEFGQVIAVLAVTIDAAGQIFADGKAVTGAELMERSRDALAKNPDLRAVIMADQRTTWANVVQALDALRRAGVTKIAFGVVPER